MLIAVGTIGCTTPLERCDAIARAHDFSRTVVHGSPFDHLVYATASTGLAQTLHVYLEGDGTPYLTGQVPAPDPTPRRPVMLQLMTLDDGLAVYVGRPCYFGFAATPPCTVIDWTSARFSQQVVESLRSVVEELREQYGVRSVEIFGHSGGGTLAALLARRLTGVERVVTLAGNLDTAAWTALHGYSPLTGSINPVDEGALPAGIGQLHVVGERDRNVPSSIVESAAKRLGAGQVRIAVGVGHTCCWESQWPTILAGH
jgi:pimeloyl-ACP methyl ester carboxylesterase